MTTKDFSKAKIYKIVSSQTDKCYIGSTIKEYLSNRLSAHKYDYKIWKEGKKNHITSFDILQYDDAEIILIENYPCKDINELRARERFWIDSSDCVNKYKPGRTDKEYRSENKDQIRKYKQTYYKENKEEIKKINNQYRQDHQEELKQCKQKWYQDHKEEINQKRSQEYNCECGSVIQIREKSNHIKTKKHQTFMQQNTTA